MIDPNIRAIFDDECQHLVIDVNLLKKIRNFCQAFVNRNEDHIAFFGGNLLGVYQVRFRNSDSSMWFDDIMDIDDVSARRRIIQLPSLKAEWKRGTDVMNLGCLWLVHKIYNSNLPTNQKHQGMMDVLLALHYKFLSSIQTHYFPHPVDKSIGLAVYAALSKKFSLKVYGSWGAMLNARCSDIIDIETTIHRRAIESFNEDNDVQKMITDTQGRMRNMIKKIYPIFKTIHTHDAKIHSGKMTMLDIDGGEVIRDMSRNFSPYRRYLHEIVSDHTQFKKDELVGVIYDAMPTMPPKHLVDTLDYLSKEYKRDEDVEKVLDETLYHAFEFLHADRSVFAKSNNLGLMITKLRANYMSSRSSDESLMKMRELMEGIVKRAAKSKNPSVIASVRTGTLLYVVLRTFAKNAYT